MPDASWIQALSPIVSAVVAALAAVAYVHRLNSGTERAAMAAISALKEAMVEAVKNVGEMAHKDNIALQETERRSRHDLATNLQNALVSVRADMERLKENAATREEVRAIEGRLTVAVNKVEQAIGGLTDKLSLVVEVKAQSKMNADVLEKHSGALERLAVMMERLLTRAGLPSPNTP